MSKGSTFILRLAIVAIGLIVSALCVVALPTGIMSDATGLYRPLLIGLYIPAVPFFSALYQAMKLLNYIEQDEAFSHLSAIAFARIKYCALAITVVFLLGMPYIFIVADKDDAPGVVLAGLVIAFAAFVIATFSGVLQKLVQYAVDIKSENDLTV